MNFLEKEWFRIAILIILIVAIVLAFVYETKQQQVVIQQHVAESNFSCQKLAMQKKAKIIQNNIDYIKASIQDLHIYSYEYRYSQKYEACILAYTGYISGFFKGSLLSGFVFKIVNLSNGESLLYKLVGNGTPYDKARATFNKMQAQYIGSTTPSK